MEEERPTAQVIEDTPAEESSLPEIALGKQSQDETNVVQARTASPETVVVDVVQQPVTQVDYTCGSNLISYYFPSVVCYNH